MKFLASTLLFIPWAIVWVVSLFVVPFMLLTKWDGKTTIFGNFKYGRGDTHYSAPSDGEYWKQVRFLVIRNPVSNFGKRILAVDDKPWVWLYDVQVYKALHWKYGWKLPSGEMPTRRTFVYRPYFTQSKLTPPGKFLLAALLFIALLFITLTFP